MSTDFSADKQKLSDLVKDDSSYNNDGCPCIDEYEYKDMYWGSSFVWFFLIFFFIFIIVFLIIYTTQPVYVCGEKDYSDDEHYEREWGKPLLWAFVIAIFVVILIWLLYAVSDRTSSSC